MAPAPVKQSEPTPKRPKSTTSIPTRVAVIVVALAFISGIAGGFLGSRLNTSRITSLDNTATQQKIASSQSELISNIAKDVSPSVVSINVESTVGNSYFYGEQTQSSAGTGFIISSDGVIVTNKHVIPENTSKVAITTSEGTEYDNVDVIARDPRSNVDLAFLKVNGAKDLKPVKLGDSSQMVVGDSVIAIGYALGQFQNTVTSGIISGLGRPVTASDGSATSAESLTNLFQTDAAINPGNSGGPLLNMNGEVIGINTAVAGDAENIGFAIPINDVKPQISSVLEKGKLEVPYLGVRYVMLTEALQQRFDLALASGAWLKAGNDAQAVVNGSPADKAGLKEGDIIVKVNGEEITSETPLASVLSKYSVGQELDITYNRDGKEQSTKATLEVAPEARL
ncbi:MAG: trypsin-like peptidase domain-containing protein [Candidatus Saccharimonadales bacterium]